MKTTRKFWLAVGVAAALAVGGCGGGDDPVVAAPVATDVPDSAGASAGAFLSFVLALGGSDESGEPLVLKDSFAVPADDTGEPQPLS